MGRPSKFTEELAGTICDRLSKGQSLRFICDEDGMPSRETVRTWLRDNPAFSAQYARAKEDYAEAVFEEIEEIADDGRNDWIERETKRGTYIALNEEALGRSRLRIDARKWMLSKLMPKKYGDRIEVDANIQGEVKVTIGGDA